ncbi:MAG: nicotinate-nucleotide adenylyltransferase [Gemmatimonadota bacterium]
MNEPERIGIFGGAFDPPHVGHKIVAMDLVEALELDRLLVVPTARPPHRTTAWPAETRFAFARAAFAGDPRIEVSDLELRRDGPSYTVDTLERVRAVHPDARLFLVVGRDQYEGFGDWHRPERIVDLAELIVMRRDGRAPRVDGRFPFRRVDVTRVDLSSTEVRDRLAEGRSVRYLVPETIRDTVRRAWKEHDTEERTTGHGTRC